MNALETGAKTHGLIFAFGHPFPELDVEREIVSPRGFDIRDSGEFGDDVPWSQVRAIMVGSSGRVTAEMLDQAKNCEVVTRYGIGVDNIDTEAAKRRGITVCNVPDYCIEEVASHVIAFSLTFARGLFYWDRIIRSGRWRGGKMPSLKRLSGCDFGIIGFGRIGQEVARLAEPLFGRILVYDPYWDGQGAPSNIERVESLNDLLRKADFLTLHVPLDNVTRGLIGAEELALMKPTAFVVNVSRGGIIDENALAEALRLDQLGGAALDTFADEPLPPGHELFQLSNVLLTPHVAWWTKEAQRELRQRAAQEVLTVLCADRSPTERSDQ